MVEEMAAGLLAVEILAVEILAVEILAVEILAVEILAVEMAEEMAEDLEIHRDKDMAYHLVGRLRSQEVELLLHLHQKVFPDNLSGWMLGRSHPPDRLPKQLLCS
jgi:hypothetical protein